MAGVALVLAADDVGRVEGSEAAEDLVLLDGDRLGVERGRRLHRHEGEDLEEVGDDHVPERAGLLVEAGTVLDRMRLGDVDLDVVDVVQVPDRLEEAVGETQSEDVLGRLLAEVVVDPEDLLLVEDLVQLGVERPGAGEVGAERLLHDDPRVLDAAPPRRSGGPSAGRRSAGRSGSGGGGARRPRSESQPATAAESEAAASSPPMFAWTIRAANGPQFSSVTGTRPNSSQASRAICRRSSSLRSRRDAPTRRKSGISPASQRCRRPGRSFRFARSPVIP